MRCVSKFIHSALVLWLASCIPAWAQPKDAQTLFASGIVNFLQVGTALNREELKILAKNDLCDAAKQGYVYAVEYCALLQDDKVEGYLWTRKAAWMGTSNALIALAMNSAPTQQELGLEWDETDSFVAGYLLCHPAMLDPPTQNCGHYMSNDKALKSCIELQVDLKKLKQQDLTACQARQITFLSERYNPELVKTWSSKAEKQLQETLKNIKNQLRIFPNLVNDTFIPAE